MFNTSGRQLLLLTSSTHLPVQQRTLCEVLVLSVLDVVHGSIPYYYYYYYYLLLLLLLFSVTHRYLHG
jgi:hypothetical protein